MTSLPTAFALAVRQLGDPAILRVLFKSLAITLALFALLGAALGYGLGALAEAYGWYPFEGAAVLLSIIVIALGAWLLFRFVALFVLQFFADEVVAAVEARHYPDAAHTARELPFREELGNGLKSGLRALLVNAIALPLALVLVFTGVGTALLFWAVNAFLLGRELQDMVWLRHRRDEAELAPMRGPKRFLLGGAIAGLLMVPFVNLLAPVIGAASATHLVHRGRAGRA